MNLSEEQQILIETLNARVGNSLIELGAQMSSAIENAVVAWQELASLILEAIAPIVKKLSELIEYVQRRQLRERLVRWGAPNRLAEWFATKLPRRWLPAVELSLVE